MFNIPKGSNLIKGNHLVPWSSQHSSYNNVSRIVCNYSYPARKIPFKSTQCWRLTDKSDAEKSWLQSCQCECNWNRSLTMKHFIQCQDTKESDILTVSKNTDFLCTINKTNLQRAIKNLSKNITVFWSKDKVQYFCLYASAREWSPMSYYFYHRQQKDVTVLSFCKNSSVFWRNLNLEIGSCKKLFSAPQFKSAIQTLKESNLRLLLFCSGDTIWSKQNIRIRLSFSHHTLVSFPFALNL